jgi:hypothetical protein
MIMTKITPDVRSSKNAMLTWSVAAVAGLLIALPALAQTSPQATSPSSPTMQKQPTDGGDSPSNPRATDQTAAEWRKQHIDGGDAPPNPGATDASAAEWRKQHPLAQ